MRVLGIDPGSERTGFGVVESDGRSHRLVEFGAIHSGRGAFPDRLVRIERMLREVIVRTAPDVVAVEEAFHAVNVKSALKLGHARGVAILAAARDGIPIFEYSPLEVKSATVGYGRAEKHQVQEMVRLLLGLKESPQPFDAADALAVAICHIHHSGSLKSRGLDGRIR
ncbi:MAG: crossover junction endodeoxyribonuclease RuvC [Acidobacteria bacterium]|nr:crossover junction endodeoxyribonuclease RuvC [Acidobacteriota bacterium]